MHPARGSSGFGVYMIGVHVVTRLEAELQRLTGGRQAAPHPGIRIIAWKHGNAIVRQGLDHRTVFPRHRLNRMHEFMALALGLVYQSYGGGSSEERRVGKEGVSSV